MGVIFSKCKYCDFTSAPHHTQNSQGLRGLWSNSCYRGPSPLTLWAPATSAFLLRSALASSWLQCLHLLVPSSPRTASPPPQSSHGRLLVIHIPAQLSLLRAPDLKAPGLYQLYFLCSAYHHLILYFFCVLIYLSSVFSARPVCGWHRHSIIFC